MHGGRTTFVRVFRDPCRRAAGVSSDATVCRRVPDRRPSLVVWIIAVSAVRAAAALAGGVPVTGFTLADLQALAGASFAAACTTLHAAGLAGIAEVQLDRLDSGSSNAIAAGARLWSGVESADRGGGRPGSHCRSPCVRENCRMPSAGSGRSRRSPAPCRSPTPSTGYDDVKGVAIAQAAGDRHRVDTGRLVVVRARSWRRSR